MPELTFRDFEMPNPGTPTIDQLKVFLSVVEAGSFAAAGRRLGRATSAISYTVANLETQLGVTLFDREQTRKPTLTEAGGAVPSQTRGGTARGGDPSATLARPLAGLAAHVVLVGGVVIH